MRNLTTLQAIALATQLGLAFAVAVLMGLFIGHLADDWLGTLPILTILGALLGLAAGAYSSAQIGQMLIRKKE
jgi:F0F1-type ATP synthase assembly protein I